MAIDLEKIMGQVMDMAKKSQGTQGINTYWGGTSSNASRAADRAEWQMKLGRIDDQRKQADLVNMNREKTDTEAYKAELAAQRAEAVAKSRDATALQVADIRAGGDGSGSSLGGGGRNRGTLTELEASKLATERFTKQTALPGQPQQSYNDIYKEITNAPTAIQKAQKDADGRIIKGSASPSAAPTSVPVAVPTALTKNQWQQYADTKSPGMQYERTQPGMVGDQIARFKKPDGTAFFANTGAVQQSPGSASALPAVPATVPTPRGAGPQPVPDVLRPTAVKPMIPQSELTVSGQQRPTPPLVEGINKWKQSLTAPGGNFGPIDLNMAEDIAPVLPQSYKDATDRALSVGTQGQQIPTGFTPSPMEAMKETPGFLDWWIETSRRNMPARKPKTASWFDIPTKSTNPLMPNYGQ